MKPIKTKGSSRRERLAEGKYDQGTLYAYIFIFYYQFPIFLNVSDKMLSIPLLESQYSVILLLVVVMSLFVFILEYN
jgi:hypothetical protein